MPTGQNPGRNWRDRDPVAWLRRIIERAREPRHAYVPRHVKKQTVHDRLPTSAPGSATVAAAAVVVTVGLLATGGQTDPSQLSGTGGPTSSTAPQADIADRGGDPASRRERPAQQAPEAAEPKPKAKPKPKVKTPPPWAAPVHRSYRLTSGFGQRWGAEHGGLDVAAPLGTPIRTVRAGMVERAGWYGGYGKVVIVNHGGGVRTLYGHNSWLLVKPGQRLTIGQPIALLGSTGRSTGPHLHLEVRIDGEKVDPLPYLRQRGVRL